MLQFLGVVLLCRKLVDWVNWLCRFKVPCIMWAEVTFPGVWYGNRKRFTFILLPFGYLNTGQLFPTFPVAIWFRF